MWLKESFLFWIFSPLQLSKKLKTAHWLALGRNYSRLDIFFAKKVPTSRALFFGETRLSAAMSCGVFLPLKGSIVANFPRKRTWCLEEIPVFGRS